jgi:hypothetical protein
MNKALIKLFYFFAVCFFACFSVILPVTADETANEEVPLNQYGIHSNNPYVTNRFIDNEKTIDEIIVPGPPTPPAGFVRELVAELPVPNQAAGINVITNVPASTWAFGCSATSASMMFGHYDNAGYPNMYTGLTNGGVFPMTNDSWGTVLINGETRALNPLSATRNGLDGRAIKGHVDDYWVKYGDEGPANPDPFINKWTEHTQGECTADYMGTNQDAFGNSDGSTTFYFNYNGSPLYNYAAPSGHRDGCYGMKLFVESRGYTVQSNGNFNQYILGSTYCSPAPCTTGFTFDNFKAEIDAGRPVLIQVAGHTMLGFGYDDSTSTIHVHDTWDYMDHTMTWGGIYSGMQHYGVTVLRLSVTTPIVATSDATVLSATSAAGGGAVSATGGTTILAEGVCWDSSANPTIAGTCTNDGTDLGTFTSSITGLNAGTTYHVRAYATISTGTSYGSDIAFFSFCWSPAIEIGSTPYATINQAIINTISGDIIEINTAQFTEDLSFSQSGNVTLQGGYDCVFNTTPSMSIVRSVTIAGTGSVALANIIIQ